jgi:pimeloyl-ACP methyl ester carboxylesterase
MVVTSVPGDDTCLPNRPGSEQKAAFDVNSRMFRASRSVILATFAFAAFHANPAFPQSTSNPSLSVPDSTKGRELVVLVHGMGRSPLSMLPMALAVKRAGYDVMNWGYSSTCCSVAEIGDKLAAELAEVDQDYDRIHFVGHSLGTVIIRWVLAKESALPAVGRVVMLAPPNQGSHKADEAARHWSWLLKPLPELKTEPTSTARTIPLKEGIPVGVIAGQFDGKVAVAETHLDGAAGHIVLPAAHTFLMFRRDVQRLTITFLQQGSFTVAEAIQ